MGRDYNAKHVDWGSIITTTKGSDLRKAVQETGCSFYTTGKPTYWPTGPNKILDLLDFFTSRKVFPNFIDTEEYFNLDSDHSAVILTLSERIIKKVNKSSLVNRTTDWESFRLELESKIQLNFQLRTKHQLETEAEKFNNIIQTTIWSNTKEITHRAAANNYPREIRVLVKGKK